MDLGKIAFYIGVLVSVVLAWTDIPYATWILVALGVIVGLLNITAKETQTFLLAALVMITAGVSIGTGLGEPLKSILHAFAAFVAAAGLVVALKAIYQIEKAR